MKVLIADSSPEIRQRLLTLMQEIPTAELLAPASSAQATLESLRENDPEVLIVDARILGARAIELLKTIRREKPGVVLVILSNLAFPPCRRRYEAAGADLFIDKSHEFIRLQQFVRELSRRPEVGEDVAAPDSMRKRLSFAKLSVGLDLALFMFSAQGLFLGW